MANVIRFGTRVPYIIPGPNRERSSIKGEFSRLYMHSAATLVGDRHTLRLPSCIPEYGHNNRVWYPGTLECTLPKPWLQF